MNEQQENLDLNDLKKEALTAIQNAAKTAYAYACAADGEERIKAFEVYENIRVSTRV